MTCVWSERNAKDSVVLQVRTKGVEKVWYNSVSGGLVE
jgi:hypothetical protein